MKFIPVKEKFYKAVLIPNENGCMIWIADKTIPGWKGYGRLRDIGKKRLLAHHLSYKLHCGDIPKGMLVLHTCDVRACVSPDHLFLGSSSDNAKDRHKKNRDNQNCGEKNYLAKFTNEEAKNIRRKYQNGGITTRQLAKKYGVTQATIQYLLVGKTYKNV